MNANINPADQHGASSPFRICSRVHGCGGTRRGGYRVRAADCTRISTSPLVSINVALPEKPPPPPPPPPPSTTTEKKKKNSFRGTSAPLLAPC
ncbi:hypothetical protein F2P81_009349 [Scophthalmus maximus]|uniref:Uncharacterized protein n=1 Tax=Scophthalmus maximus TaxID=52904 RepID=A0A6A4T1C9_SCOMX|nr:hypothetical protein F2P81_009349 [Scophthalmus maximus]